MNTIRGSLNYNGNKIYVTPGEHLLDDTLIITLDYQKISDRAEFMVLKMKNPGTQNSGQISEAKTFDVTYQTQETPLYHTLAGDSCGAASFMPVSFLLKKDYHEEPEGGRSSNTTGFPYFDLSFDQQAMVMAIGWSGQWSKDFCVCDNGFEMKIGLCDCDFYLKPGEEVRFPSFLLVHGTDPTETRRYFRNIIRDHFSPKRYLGENFRVPTAIQCFDRYFQALSNASKDDSWATEKGQKRTIDAAAKIRHINTLWLDAAWFYKGFPHGVGNFRFSEGFPNGLMPVSEYAHHHDMKFVVWFEPERVYEGSDLYPQEEKLLKLDETNPTRLYNLADETARIWLENTLIRMIRDNGIDVYRQDFNMDPLPYWRISDEPNRKGITELKYINGFYRLWDRLLAEFPNLLIDNCSSGGRRLDLETSMRSITLWRSDTGCFGENEKMRVTVWNHNQILGLSEYLPYHACAVWDIDAYTVRSTATHGMACNFDIFHPDFDFEKAEKIMQEVKTLSPCWDGDFYPLTEATVSEKVWSAYQLALDENGALYVFRREQSPDAVQTIKFHALTPDADYSLTFIDENLDRKERIYRGEQLLNGIDVQIPNKRNSLVITYQKL